MSAGFRNHPPTRLFLERERAGFEAALAAVRQEFGREYRLRIGGEEVSTAEMVPVPNASHRDGPPIGFVPVAAKADVERAVRVAGEAQAAWAQRSVNERAASLRTAAALLTERQKIVAAWEVYEAAKAWAEALADVDEAIDYLNFYAGAAEQLEVCWGAYRPRGVTAVIPPWNFPAAIPCGMTSAALIAGNTVILKPAEQTPLVSYQLVKVLHEAGVPEDAVCWLPGKGEESGAALVGSPDVDMVAFTGSAAVGTAIYREGCRVELRRGGLRHTVAEMGGKNAVLVFPDADLDEAVVAILRSAFGHANQKCSAASRVLVHHAIYDRFSRRLAQGASSLPVGGADEPGTVITPLIDEDAKTRVSRAQEQAASEGTVLLKPAPPNSGSTLVSPMLVEIAADRAATASTTQQEIFGPVLALSPFRDERQALALANDSRYALTAGVFSRSPSTIARAVSGLDAGNIYVNRPTTGARVGVEPFGGHKMSGTGPKAGSVEYLWAFVTSRSGLRSGGQVRDGGRAFSPEGLRPWKANVRSRFGAVRAALSLLHRRLRERWLEAAGAEASAALAGVEGLLAQEDQLAVPEITIELPGQKTHVRWDMPRGCGLVLTDEQSSTVVLTVLACAAILAGNGVILLPDAGQTEAARALRTALADSGVPRASLMHAPEDTDAGRLAALPVIAFAAVDAGLNQSRLLHRSLADASGTLESPRMKALIHAADGPGLGQAGFLRRFAIPKTVAIRTLHLGAELELPGIEPD